MRPRFRCCAGCAMRSVLHALQSTALPCSAGATNAGRLLGRLRGVSSSRRRCSSCATRSSSSSNSSRVTRPSCASERLRGSSPARSPNRVASPRQRRHRVLEQLRAPRRGACRRARRARRRAPRSGPRSARRRRRRRARGARARRGSRGAAMRASPPPLPPLLALRLRLRDRAVAAPSRGGRAGGSRLAVGPTGALRRRPAPARLPRRRDEPELLRLRDRHAADALDDRLASVAALELGRALHQHGQERRGDEERRDRAEADADEAARTRSPSASRRRRAAASRSAAA